MPSVGWKCPASRQSSALPGDRVAEVEFVRANHVAFGANAKQLALDCIEMNLGISNFSANTLSSESSRRRRGTLTIGRGVFVSVGYPGVGYARGSSALPHGGTNLSAGDAMFDPEFSNRFVGMG